MAGPITPAGWTTRLEIWRGRPRRDTSPAASSTRQEAVAAVGRDREGRRSRRPQRAGNGRERREARHVEAGDLRQVVAHEPVACDVRRVEREHHDAAARHAPQLGESRPPVAPVMHRQDRHRRVEGAVGERQRLGGALYGRRRAGGPLRDHHGRGLDRHDLAVARLVGADAGADVDDRARVAECVCHRPLDARVGAARACVGGADAVVGRHARSWRSSRSMASGRLRRPKPRRKRPSP